MGYEVFSISVYFVQSCSVDMDLPGVRLTTSKEEQMAIRHAEELVYLLSIFLPSARIHLPIGLVSILTLSFWGGRWVVEYLRPISGI